MVVHRVNEDEVQFFGSPPARKKLLAELLHFLWVIPINQRYKTGHILRHEFSTKERTCPESIRVGKPPCVEGKLPKKI